ncbi:PEP-CTERM sorting domain-containing protein [Niveibacterium sp. COAC-50]|uniref:PEP-CTERM sorting domain-containing protein n=1 Tax=Niveibacterium sp. COAC-50 TaxID=2729384 RepID=UPI001C12F19D|nr:PEP-CTERM sorting domain-containing protein [Niveibacterium sp. COAC-50]
MKKPLLTAILALCAHAAGATETLLNFDDFVGGSSFNYGGLHWESSVPLVNGYGNGGGSYDPSSPGDVEYQGAGELTLSLVGGGQFDVNSIGLLAGTFAVQPPVVTAYRDGALIYTIPEYGHGWDYTVTINKADTVKFNWDGAGLRMDDLKYSVAAVPEPETYALMLSGLALVGLRARRRNQG